jgi:hypothetical protein
MKKIKLFAVLLLCHAGLYAQGTKLPDTGISGLYEVVLAVKDKNFALRYFADYGFTVVDSASVDRATAEKLYKVPSALKSYRLQNGNTDSHGLLRLWVWERPLGEGVGYAQPEAIGQRLAVMKTTDIYRLFDLYSNARANKQPWLPSEPIADDLFGLNKSDGKFDWFKRPVLVRENCVYGAFFNHVFFQRYGYHIEGYGKVNDKAPLKTSEFTHHDFFIRADSMQQVSYLGTALGLKAEKEPEVDGDFLRGPERVFFMEPGYSHWYQGFVSPNNICGKLKFFIPRAPKPDLSARQRLGELGMTLHTFYTPRLQMVYDLVRADKRLTPTAIQKNEFGERSFVFTDQTGCTWQIIERTTAPKNTPVTVLKFEMTVD